MSDETKNTGGEAGAEKPATDAGNDNAPAQTPSESGVSGVDGRIAGLTAEKKRWQERAEAAQRELDAEREKSKSEHEKMLDAARKEAVESFRAKEHEPITQRLQKIEATLNTHLEAKMGQLPEDYRVLVPESLPLDEKLAHVDRLLSTIASNKSASIGGGVNPPGEGKKRTYTMREIEDLGRDPQKWLEVREDVMAAQREGRIKDLE